MRALMAALLMLTLVLAGCASEKDDGGEGTTTTSTSTTATATGPSTTTGTGAPTVRTARLAADVDNGTAPLVVNFTLNASAGAQSWRMAFGDGGVANGTGHPPAFQEHNYTVAGNFSATLNVTFGSGSARASVNITVTLPAGGGSGGAGAPDQLVFEFADSLGCAGDLPEHGPEDCVSFTAGPEFSGIDGYWQAFDERYWGLSFTSTIVQGGPVPAGPVTLLADSDCVFTDAAHAIIGEANNGGSTCAGQVPPGTAFLFIYPYATPALEMVVTFTV